MFTFVILLIGLFAAGYILGKAMPQVSELAWAAIAGIALGYSFIYNNIYLWGSLLDKYSEQTVTQVRLIATIIGIAVFGGITALGVVIGKRR